jgi:hypothetical protein
MASDVPPELKTAVNHAVLAHLEGKSAHSDIAQVLTDAVKPLGDVQLFCPNWQAFRYVIASTKGVIFGFAIGMNTIAFRLDEKMKGRALLTGGIEYPACGKDWVEVVHHGQDSDWPAVDVRFWARKAYVYARGA